MIKLLNKAQMSNFLLIVLTSMILLILFMAACQSTPENEIVKNKNNSIADVILESKKNEDQYKKHIADYKTPEKVTQEYDFINVKLSMNAVVDIPAVERIQSIVLKEKGITQDMVDSFIQYFIGDATLVEKIITGKTVPEIEEDIAEIKREIFECQSNWEEKSKVNPYKEFDIMEDAVTYLNDEIKQLEDEMKSAPQKAKYESTNRTLKTYEDTPTGWLELYGYANVPEGNIDGHARIDVMGNSNYVSLVYKNITEDFNPQQSHQELLDGIKISETDAMLVAQKVASDFDIDEINTYAHSVRVYTKDGELVPYHSFFFTKSICGIPITSFNVADDLKQDSVFYSPQISPELIYIDIDADGLQTFSWSFIKERVEILDEDVKILTFDEIKSIFDEKIKQNVYSEEKKLQVNITKISLSFMLVRVKDEPNIFVTVPVWDFRGYHYYTEDLKDIEQGEKYERMGTDTWTYLTINAIDGSVIDRRIGY